MKKELYRMYSYNPDGGEETEGYIELSKEEKEKLEGLSSKQHTALQFELEKTLAGLSFKRVEEQVEKRIEERKNQQKEKMQCPEYVELKEKIDKLTEKRLEEYRKANKGKETEMGYMTGLYSIVEDYNIEMSYLDIVYINWLNKQND